MTSNFFHNCLFDFHVILIDTVLNHKLTQNLSTIKVLRTDRHVRWSPMASYLTPLPCAMKVSKSHLAAEESVGCQSR